MRCEKLTPKEREFFLTLKAMNRTVAEAKEEFYAHYPDAWPYTHETLKRWMASKDGKEELARISAGVRSTARDESFANKDNRIMAMVELAEKDLEKLRSLDPLKNNREYVSLGKDFRELLTRINEEVDPYGTGDEKITSTIEAFVDRIEKGDAPDWVKQRTKELVLSKAQIQPN